METPDDPGGRVAETRSADKTGSPPVPVTILTGYLGAGKTTLLNHILSADHGRRIAIIENEYGAVSIDHGLVVDAQDEIFEMANGCICCTVRDDLIRLLDRLMQRGVPFDHLLVETTGLADPGPVAQTFFTHGPIRETFALDGIVTVIDALHIEQQLARGGECVEQIVMANVLVLNKTDLVTPDQLGVVEARLRQINPMARRVRSERAVVPMNAILDLDAFDRGRISSHHVHAMDHHHDDDIMSVVVEAEGEVNVAILDVWLGHVLRTQRDDIFRLKGFLSLPGDPRRLVFQAVHSIVDAQPGRPWGDGPRLNQLVFVGRNLDEKLLTDGLRACVV